MTLLWVVLGAAVGAPLRYLVDGAVQSWHNSRFPWGTLTVNIIGSLLLGGLIAVSPSAAIQAAVGTGLCGALTTYSTFSYETLRLAQHRSYLLAGLNVLISVVAGLGAAYAGMWLMLV